jgi:hypothetical protein
MSLEELKSNPRVKDYEKLCELLSSLETDPVLKRFRTGLAGFMQERLQGQGPLHLIISGRPGPDKELLKEALGKFCSSFAACLNEVDRRKPNVHGGTDLFDAFTKK